MCFNKRQARSREFERPHDSGTGDGEFSLVQLASGDVKRIYAGPLHYDFPV